MRNNSLLSVFLKVMIYLYSEGGYCKSLGKGIVFPSIPILLPSFFFNNN